MFKKGISEIIGEILLVIIAVSLVGVAFLFIYSFYISRTSKTIALSASCDNGNITLTVSNVGTEEIRDGEIKVFINNEDITALGEFSGLDPLTPRDTSTDTYDGDYSGSTEVLVVSPSNSISQTVVC